MVFAISPALPPTYQSNLFSLPGHVAWLHGTYGRTYDMIELSGLTTVSTL